MAKNEAANVGGGQMVRGLERFAIKFGLSPVGNGELWKVFKGMTLLEKDNSATVWRRSPQEANALVAPLHGILTVFLS